MSQHNINALAGFDWSKVLSKVDQKWHASFKEYALTGQGSEEFLQYLNDSDNCDEALDAVLDYMMCAFSVSTEKVDHSKATL
jgi:hypothetical protein